MWYENLKWKMVERPLIPVNNSYVDAFPFLVICALLFIAGAAMKSKHRQALRLLVQSATFIFFIFVVHRCFCSLRGAVFGLRQIGRNDLLVFNSLFIAVPLVAFTVLSGRVFCGWLCPLGAAQELFFRVPPLKKFVINFSKTARKIKLFLIAGVLFLSVCLLLIFKPKTYFFMENIAALWGIVMILAISLFLFRPGLDRKLKKIRYASFFAFIFIILLGVFTTDPWCALFGNEIDYSSMIAFMSVGLSAVLVGMAWCRYICPLGCFLGILSGRSSVKIRKDVEKRLSKKATGEICYTEALGPDAIDESSCLYCGRCVDVKVSKIDEK